MPTVVPFLMSTNIARKYDTRFDTAIFLTCRSLSHEAMSTFYAINTVRFQSYRYYEQDHALARNIVFNKEFSDRFFGKSNHKNHERLRADWKRLLDTLVTKEKLKKVAVECAHPNELDAAGCFLYHRSLDVTSLDPPLRCVELGVFQARTRNVRALKGKFFFEYLRLTEVLPRAKEMVDQYEVVELYSKFKTRHRTMLYGASKHEYNALGLAMWIAAFETYRAIMLGHQASEETSDALKEYWVTTPMSKREKELMAVIPVDVKLLQLDAETHGQRLMALASDTLLCRTWPRE